MHLRLWLSAEASMILLLSRALVLSVFTANSAISQVDVMGRVGDMHNAVHESINVLLSGLMRDISLIVCPRCLLSALTSKAKRRLLEHASLHPNAALKGSQRVARCVFQTRMPSVQGQILNIVDRNPKSGTKKSNSVICQSSSTVPLFFSRYQLLNHLRL